MKDIDRIIKAYEKGYSRTETLKAVRDKIKNIPDFNIREKNKAYDLLRKATVLIYVQEGMIYKTQRKVFEGALHKIQDKAKRRNRKMELVKNLRHGRIQGEVFYLCSSHNKCAKDHKDYQGKIYVDRYWKNTLKDDPELMREVGAYIKNHNVDTVQYICGAPVYMMTRPYCKHYFIPVSIAEVLNSSLNKIVSTHRAQGNKEK